VALTSAVVKEFLTAEKSVSASERLRWVRRNEAVVVSRAGVSSGGATVGELVLIVRVVVPRNWTFKLLRRGDEVVRWALTAPPARHSNPPGRPAELR